MTSLVDEFTLNQTLNNPNAVAMHNGAIGAAGAFTPSQWYRTIGVNGPVYGGYSYYSPTYTLWISGLDFRSGSVGPNGSTGIPNNVFMIKEKGSISVNLQEAGVAYEYMDYYLIYDNTQFLPRLDLTSKTGFKIQGVTLSKSPSGLVDSENITVDITIKAPLVGINIVIKSQTHDFINGTDVIIPFSEFSTHPLYDPKYITEIKFGIRSYRTLESNRVVPLDLMFTFDKLTTY